MVSKRICFYVSKIKNNVNYKWLREREREHMYNLNVVTQSMIHAFS